MQTNFTESQLQDPQMAASEKILRTCVHCGFCTATCPTYNLLGDELDSPRGRIYLMKNMFENDAPATKDIVTHLDRCLSCLSCMSTCPSGVNYMHLIDHGREHIEKTYKRPWHDRGLRFLLSKILPYPRRFRLALIAAWYARPLRHLSWGRLRAMLALAPASAAIRTETDEFVQEPYGKRYPAIGERKKRVALLTGCAQTVLAPEINATSISVLQKLGVEVIVPQHAGCCGALTHHMGKTEAALESAKRNIDAWTALDDLDALVVNTSGCGTTVKDYGFMLRGDEDYAHKAEQVSSLASDVSEFIVASGLWIDEPAFQQTSAQVESAKSDLRVTYHAACSLQHGQQVKTEPLDLLEKAGFKVAEVPMGHLCCGSAGTYNLLQPEIAEKLKQQKLTHIASTKPDLVVAGNIGCIKQLSTNDAIPVVHTIQLLDWHFGGARPF